MNLLMTLVLSINTLYIKNVTHKSALLFCIASPSLSLSFSLCLPGFSWLHLVHPLGFLCALVRWRQRQKVCHRNAQIYPASLLLTHLQGLSREKNNYRQKFKAVVSFH